MKYFRRLTTVSALNLKIELKTMNYINLKS